MIEFEKFEGEIRTDYRTGSRVIFSPIRDKKPMDFSTAVGKWESDISRCPFEYANDSLNRTIKYIGGDRYSWKLRAIENKFPFTFPDLGLFSSGAFLKKSTPFGYSEVLVETPVHDLPFEEIGEEERILWLENIVEREEALYSRDGIKYVYVFKNEGPGSGASLFHAHSQIMAFPDVTPAIATEAERIKENLKKTGKCLYEEALPEEKDRLLIENGTCVAFAPFASKFTAETVVMPKRHVNYAAGLSEGEVRDMVRLLSSVISVNKKLFGRLPYNLVFHELKSEKDFHFHIEIYYRVITFAAVEFAGFYTNQLIPETYADIFSKEMDVAGKQGSGKDAGR